MSRRVLLMGSVIVLLAASMVIGVVLATSSDGDDDRPLDAAMAVLPAGDVDSVTFTDMAAARERLGHGDLTFESSGSEYEAFINDSLESPWTGSLLAQYYQHMDEWGWNFTDVEWEATYSGDDAVATAFKLREDLDMGTVEAGFEEHGYDRSETDGYPTFTLNLAEMDDAAIAVAPLQNAVLLPDEHLILSGPDVESLIDAASGETATLAGSDAASDLLAAVDAPEYLSLSIGESSCVDPIDAVGESADPELQAALRARLEETAGYTDLHDPIGHAAAITSRSGEPVAQAFAAYGDSQTAAAEVAPRQDFIDNGPSLLSGEPYAEMFDAEVADDGALVRYDLSGDEALRRLVNMVQNRDTPWAFCAPGA